jgi:membrane protease YdiL (CAAX protease family)
VLVTGSGILFGAAHSAQGPRGVAAATVLGVLLGVAFHLTGSLLLVVIVHYALDLVEFLLHRDQASPSSSRQY